MSSGAKVIYHILNNNAAVTAIVSNRIFPQVAKQGAEFPAIIYSRETAIPENSKDGAGDIDYQRYEIKMYAAQYPVLETLVEAVRAALDFASGTYNGVQVDSCSFITSRDAFSEDQTLYGRLAEYQLRIVKQ